MTENISDSVRAAIEALLFVSERPLYVEQIKKVLGLGTEDVKLAIESLKSEYEAPKRGMRICEIAGGFQMVTAREMSPFLKKLYKNPQSERVSKQALETLAIIAYKQPVTKLGIESLRNVNIDGVIKSLLERQLIRIAGRKKAPGRPKVYGTTREFLECFGLKSLEDLPKVDNIILPKVEEGEVVLNTEARKEGSDGLNQPAQENR
jgi:segregation and condensation protein B